MVSIITYALISIYLRIKSSVEITGWIYVDNWFELYFNGEKVATDPITFKPHNAVKISFTAPDTGLYSYTIWAQDYANDVTGLEDRNGGTCLGDGGIRIKLSDGTISNSNWKCFIVMEGPYETSTCSYTNECTNNPDTCTVQYNDYPSCWNQTTCAAATSWQSATTYDNIDGCGVPTEDYECCGLQDTYTQTDKDNCAAIYPSGCGPCQLDWGDASYMWTGDLNLHNRLICRYEYCVDGSSDCTSEPTSAHNNNSDEIKIDSGIAIVVVIILLICVFGGLGFWYWKTQKEKGDELVVNLGYEAFDDNTANNNL